MRKRYRLTGADGLPYLSDSPGQLGGHRGTKVYGRLDCPTALRALAKGDTYRRHRVFFADEPSAIAAGFRPCARCLPAEYKLWRVSGRKETGG
jgi:methylphosphotriester-DNA--protein-cysteine methyltransferase